MGPQLDPAVHPSFTLLGPDRQERGCWVLKEAKVAFKRRHLEGITPRETSGTPPSLAAAQPCSPGRPSGTGTAGCLRLTRQLSSGSPARRSRGAGGGSAAPRRPTGSGSRGGSGLAAAADSRRYRDCTPWGPEIGRAHV